MTSTIKKSAEMNFRSINSEILYRLKSSISHKKTEVDLLLSKIAAIHKEIDIPDLNDSILYKAKNEGRL